MSKDIFIHPSAEVHTEHIGTGTRVWQYCVILADARIGDGCNICSHCFIENDVVLGNEVTVKCGVQLWDGLRVGNGVFIGPNATFTNDKRPRSKQYLSRPMETVLEDGCSIGANATILPGIRVGSLAMVGAGAVLTESVPPTAIVVGNPASIVGYVDTTVISNAPESESNDLQELCVEGAKFVRLKRIPDLRGTLCAGEIGAGLPFEPKRVFFVMDVPNRRVRGAHAHRKCRQFLLCPRGSVAVVLDDGKHRQEVILAEPNLGLDLMPGVWAVQYKYTSDALLFVAASDPYDSDDYIRDYAGFIRWKNISPAGHMQLDGDNRVKGG